MLSLTARDKSVLVDLFRLRLLTVSKIARLHFPNPKKARERLKILHDARLVDRFTPYRSFLKQEHVYLLKLRGARVVAAAVGKPLRNLIWRHKSPVNFSFLMHFFSVNDFRIALELACRGAGLTHHFLPEYSLYRGAEAKRLQKAIAIFSPVSQRPFVPDGVFSLANGEGKKLLFFLEIDRGTEPLRATSGRPCVLSKLMAYADYFDGGEYRYYSKEFNGAFRGFRVLWVTSSEVRLHHVQDMCADAGLGFVWLATLRDVISEKFLGNVWRVPGMTRTQSLVPGGMPLF